MSCGKPHETDCSEVLAEVWLFLDNECNVDRRKLLVGCLFQPLRQPHLGRRGDAPFDRRKLLEKHLDECSPCLERYGLDEHLKTLLATKCGGEHAPDGLKQRLRATIRKTVRQHGAVTVETTSATVETAEG